MSNGVRTTLAVVFAAIGLSGCVESLPDYQASMGNVRPTVAATTGASPRAATMTIASLDGVPDAVGSRFDRIFAKEAASREIAMVDPSAARFLVRGYLSAHLADAGGTEISFVYDIFDAADRRRVGRVADVLTLPGSNPDPWALVDDRVAASLAGRSADVLAAALAGTDVALAKPTTLAEAAPPAAN